MTGGREEDEEAREGEDLERRMTSVRSEPSARTRGATSRRRHPSRRHLGGDGSGLRPGTQMHRYVILERVGRGGMGDVFLAYDPELDRRLALKVLREAVVGSRSARDHERLRREAQALARLSHPNVVTIYDVGLWRGRTFIVMELIEGIHLGRWLRQQRRAIEEVLAVFMDAGRGLAAAHAAGIVHRDFKPANVMVGDDGRVCVLDFGLATAGDGPSAEAGRGLAAAPGLASIDHSGLTGGTPAYMAPEQHRREDIDARSDQFSFCVSLFEAVVGMRPFAGHDPGGLLRAKQRHLLRNVPEAAQVPSWLQEIMRRGLAPDPEDRFASMDDLLAALSQGAAPSRQPRRVGLLALALGILGALGLVWTLKQVPSPCDTEHSRAAERWSEARAQAVRQAFAEAQSGGDDLASFDRVAERLDAYAQQWEASHRLACTEPQGGEVLGQRLQCLERELEQFEATLRVLERADASTVRRAARIVAGLPSPHHCNEEPLPSTEARPTQPL